MAKKLILITIIIAFVLFSYSLISQIIRAMKSGERLSYAAEEVYTLQAKNKKLKEELSWVKSSDFIQQQARDKLGLTREGETLVIIPQEKIDQVLGISKKVEEIRFPNWQGWLRVFWH